jgi:hypothetical protein
VCVCVCVCVVLSLFFGDRVSSFCVLQLQACAIMPGSGVSRACMYVHGQVLGFLHSSEYV